MKELLTQLNEQQRAAVEYISGPLVIFATAGSGKTRVITYRIVYLLHLGVSPYNILAVTFTNKAAEEMKNRIIQLAPQKGEEVWISTFHSLCAKFLYQEAENIGIKKNFVIYDETDAKKVIKECIKELSLEEQKVPISYIYDSINRAKDNLIDPESYKINTLASPHPLREVVAEVYIKYQNKLSNYNAMDFGDLIMKTIEVLKNPKYEEIKNKYTERFKYIHVDEYQDVNYAQVTLLKLLSSKHKNVCVVGDDDQAIYSWRGSDVSYLLNFKKDFSTKDVQVKEFKLEKNYRSKNSILEVANTLIYNNYYRTPKKLFSDIEGTIEEDVKILEFSDEYEEAKFVAKEIKSLSKIKDFSNCNIAVFYRVNAQSRVFEEVFREEEISYKIVGSLSFYERQEIKDILAYLKVIVNPQDNISLKRIINIPPRGIGETTVLYLETLSKEQKTSLWEQLINIDKTELSLKAKNSIWKFLTLYDILKREKDTLYPSEFIEFLINKTGYAEMIEESINPESRVDKIENLKELISLAKDYEIKQNITTIEEFLTKLSLTTNIETEKKCICQNKKNNIVSLMTLHAAKGLEFDVVFIVGLEENVFPIRWAITKKNLFSRDFLDRELFLQSYNEEISELISENIEEERRLCYVGITRARKRVYLSHCLSRIVCGTRLQLLPSRFINEIQQVLRSEDVNELTVETKDTLKPQDFKVGDYVLHQKFGIGKVTEVYKEVSGHKVVVIFCDGKKRKLDLQYTTLKKVRKVL